MAKRKNSIGKAAEALYFSLEAFCHKVKSGPPRTVDVKDFVMLARQSAELLSEMAKRVPL